MTKLLPFFCLALSLPLLAAPLKKATVTIDGFQFMPEALVLKKGGSVTFTNQDSTPHTVSPAPKSQFTGAGRLAHGEHKTIVFNKLGVQEYFCEIHPSMIGKITVVP